MQPEEKKDCPFKESTAGVRLSVGFPSICSQLIFNRVPRPIKRKRINSSTNGDGTTGNPLTKKGIKSTTSHYVQKLTQNRKRP